MHPMMSVPAVLIQRPSPSGFGGTGDNPKSKSEEGALDVAVRPPRAAGVSGSSLSGAIATSSLEEAIGSGDEDMLCGDDGQSKEG